MKTIFLLRHAKSSWGDTGLDDFDRPLAQRGEHAAQLMGRYMARLGLLPDLVLISPAVRTTSTWKILSESLPEGVATEKPEVLYLAAPSEMLDLIHHTADSVRSLMLIGHNPGIGTLAIEMAADGSAPDVRAMAEKYPTGALTEIQHDAEAWPEIDRGRLVRFVRPRDLTANSTE